MRRSDRNGSHVSSRNHPTRDRQLTREHGSGADDPAPVGDDVVAFGLVDQPVQVKGLFLDVVQECTGDQRRELLEIFCSGRAHSQLVGHNRVSNGLPGGAATPFIRESSGAVRLGDRSNRVGRR